MAAVIGRVQRELGWGDCDPAGIVFYPTYYRWMDASTWTLLAQGGWPAPRVRQEHVTIPLVHAACEFLASPTFGDLCEVRSHVSRWGRSSFTVTHEFFLQAGDKLLARGSESRVWCRYASGPGTALSSEALPADLRAALGGPAA